MPDGACRHWWVIGDNDGPTSIGVCKLCGAVKEHPNVVDWTRVVSRWGPNGVSPNFPISSLVGDKRLITSGYRRD